MTQDSTSHATVSIDAVRFHAITEAECNALIMHQLDEGVGGWVVTFNLDILCRCRRDAAFRDLIAEADVVVADGMPIVWASRLQRTPLPERVAGSSLIWSLSEVAAERNRSLYLLGGEPGAAERASEVLCERSPGLRIAGTRCPPFGFEQSARELEQIREELLATEPDIVLVALGSPKQDQLIRDMRLLLPHAWWLGVGISFSFVAGTVRRAPRWMQRSGLEWIHRLAQEPRRLARRYLVDDIPFGCGLLARSAWCGVRGVAEGRGSVA